MTCRSRSPRRRGRGCRYRGQTRNWIALRFTGDDDEINARQLGGGHHKPEFTAWRWERLENTPALITPVQARRL